MPPVRALPVNQLMPAASSPDPPDAASHGGRPGKNERLRHLAGSTPSAITSPGRHTRPRTKIRLGAGAHSITAASSLQEGRAMT